MQNALAIVLAWLFVMPCALSALDTERVLARRVEGGAFVSESSRIRKNDAIALPSVITTRENAFLAVEATGVGFIVFAPNTTARILAVDEFEGRMSLVLHEGAAFILALQGLPADGGITVETPESVFTCRNGGYALWRGKDEVGFAALGTTGRVTLNANEYALDALKELTIRKDAIRAGNASRNAYDAFRMAQKIPSLRRYTDTALLAGNLSALRTLLSLSSNAPPAAQERFDATPKGVSLRVEAPPRARRPLPDIAYTETECAEETISFFEQVTDTGASYEMNAGLGFVFVEIESARAPIAFSGGEGVSVFTDGNCIYKNGKLYGYIARSPRDLERAPNGIEFLWIKNASALTASSFFALKTIALRVRAIKASRATDETALLLAALPTITALDISDTLVGDKGLRALSEHTNLRALWLSNTRITDAEGSRFARMQSLYALDVSGTKIGEKTLSALSSLPSLRALFLTDVPLPKKCITALAALTNLRALSLARTKIDECPALPLLRALDITDTRIGNDALSPLCMMTNMQALNLSGTAIKNDIAGILNALTALRALSVSDTAIDDGAIHTIAPSAPLRALDVSGTRITGDALIALTAFKTLSSVDVSRTKRYVSDLDPLAALPNLRALRASSLRSTIPEEFSFLMDLEGLRFLTLADTTLPSGATDYLKGLTNLRALDVSGTSFSDYAVPAVKGMPWLLALTIPRTRVTDEGFYHLKTLPRLLALCASENLITDYAFEYTREFPVLRTLWVDKTEASKSASARMEQSAAGLTVHTD